MSDGVVIQRLYEQLPHAGAMQLISEVLAWDQRSISCRICNHASPEHPMRHAGGLPAVCSLEYAAQAAALHTVLSDGGGCSESRGAGLKQALVVTLRRMDLYCDDLAGEEPALLLQVKRIFEQRDAAVFDFSLQVDPPAQDDSVRASAGLLLAEGQFGVMYGR